MSYSHHRNFTPLLDLWTPSPPLSRKPDVPTAAFLESIAFPHGVPDKHSWVGHAAPLPTFNLRSVLGHKGKWGQE